jgi:hypothetical protein
MLAMRVIEKVGNGFRRRINADGHVLDKMSLDAAVERFRAEANDLNGRFGDPGTPFPKPDRDANVSWNAIRELVIRKCRVEADNALGDEFRGFRERVVRIERSIGKLVESAMKLDNGSLPGHPG